MRSFSAFFAIVVTVTVCTAGCVDDPSDTDELAALAPSGSGNMSLEWSIFEGDAQRACADAAAAEVAVTFAGDAIEISETIDCGPGTGETADVPAGDYEVIVSLLAVDGSELATHFAGTYVVHADRTTPLGQVDLVLE